MYRTALLSLLFLSHSIELHCQKNKTNPHFSSEHFSSIDIITAIEAPFFIGLITPFCSFFTSFEHNHPAQIKRLFAREPVYFFLGTMAIAGLVLAHTECLKGFLYHQKNMVTVSSFFSKQPQNCLYQLTVTIEDYMTHMFETKIFENSNPHIVIDEITQFIKIWTNKHKTKNDFAAINITPTLLFNRGKSLHFKTKSFLWNEQVGVERTLRETLLVGTNICPQAAVTTFGYSFAFAVIGLVGHLGLRMPLF